MRLVLSSGVVFLDADELWRWGYAVLDLSGKNTTVANTFSQFIKPYHWRTIKSDDMYLLCEAIL